MSRKGPYCLVQVFPGAPAPAAQTGISDAIQRDVPWYINRVVVGCYRPAGILQELPGLDKLDSTIFEDRTIRQLGRGQLDVRGNDVGGYFVVADAAAAVIFTSKNNATMWVNNKNQVSVNIARSLTYIDSGHSSVTFCVLIYFLEIDLYYVIGNPTICFCTRPWPQIGRHIGIKFIVNCGSTYIYTT
jgi:hypothetical protein